MRGQRIQTERQTPYHAVGVTSNWCHRSQCATLPLTYRRAFCLIVSLLALLSSTLVPRVAHAATEGGTCQSFNIPVALSINQPLQFTIYGELCNPASGPSHTIELTIPGGTYGHIYWDYPYEPQTYSYVYAANAEGYSTFNIDRIGTGLSSHPSLSVMDVTMYTNAYVIHEIVQDLRNGQIGNQPFAQVVLVGHSLGSVDVWIEAGTYHDVDGVIITGLVHHLNALGLAGVLGSFYPASLDPRFANADYGAGYLTTRPGTRGQDFYYLPHADPNVVVLDEATKETATDGEVATFPIAFASGISAQILVPVLVVIGQQDNLLCGLGATDCANAAAVQQAEAPYYAQAQLQVAVIAGSGHDLNLQTTAPLWFADANAWLYQHFAP
jgi:pimeloyl-ACP methyl ester carboxylesterase